MPSQLTIQEPVAFAGIGVHCGRMVRVDMYPAAEDTGIVFKRIDLQPHVSIPVKIENVIKSALSTTIGIVERGELVEVHTIEHLMAALYAIGIDNGLVVLDGPEVPILDGSAAEFFDILAGSGTIVQNKPKKILIIQKAVQIVQGHKWSRIEPGPDLSITYSVDFGNRLISTDPFAFTLSQQSFRRDIAPARTFGFLSDVQSLRANGLARGASLENSVVIANNEILNPGGLRFSNEFTRHKILDLVGDLSMVGMAVCGNITCHRGGHTLHASLVREILMNPDNYKIE